jgi:hypothetical protein
MKFHFKHLAVAGLLATGATGLFAQTSTSGTFLYIVPTEKGKTECPIYFPDATLLTLSASGSARELKNLVKNPLSAWNSFDLTISENPIPQGGSQLEQMALDADDHYTFYLVVWCSTVNPSAPAAGCKPGDIGTVFCIGSNGPQFGSDSGYSVMDYVSFSGKVENGSDGPAYTLTTTTPPGGVPALSDSIQFDIKGPVTAWSQGGASFTLLGLTFPGSGASLD